MCVFPAQGAARGVADEEGSHRHNSRQEYLEWGINSITGDNGTALGL